MSLGTFNPSFVLNAFNPAAITPPTGAIGQIGFRTVAGENALLVFLAGGAVLAVDLDLADDEVAIGGPDSAGDRRLFRGRDNGDGTNTIESVEAPGSTGSTGTTALTPAGTDNAVVAADTTRRELQLFNVGNRDLEIYLAAAAGAAGAGFVLPVSAAGNFQPLKLKYTGAISTRSLGAAGSPRISFVSVED